MRKGYGKMPDKSRKAMFAKQNQGAGHHPDSHLLRTGINAENNAVMETTIRIGKHSHTGSKRGYYQFVKGIDNVALEDSKLLTMTPNGARHNSLKQVTEDMDVRYKTSPLHRLKYQGRSEWVDMFYATGDTNYQLYTANPPKNFNPRNVAKQIDMEDGIRGNENVYEWRDGKKHLVIKKEI